MRGLIKKVKDFTINPLYRFKVLSLLGFYNKIDDSEYLKKMYYLTFGKKLDLENPKTYNEKIQWLKIFDRNPLYTTLVDKYAVKSYVAEIIGKEFVIPTLAVWDRVEDIDYSILPESFVLKCTHDSGGIIICKNKGKMNVDETNKKLRKFLQRDFYSYKREWPYKDVPRRIIAEPYMEDQKTGELRDYKFLCFDGKVKMLYVASGRHNHDSGTRFDFFDSNYSHLELLNGYPNADILPERPESFCQMKKIAEQLSSGFKHVRIDLYEIDRKPYFGEYTLYHLSGLEPFEPEEWDYKLGNWLILDMPQKKRGQE